VSESVLQAYRAHISSNYADFLERMDLACTVEEARGTIIRDSRGRSFIDFIAGYGVFNFGHNPSDVVRALCAELEAAPLWNRPFLQAPTARLAERLAALTRGALDRVLLCSTGAEAVDSAIKLARLSTRRTEIVAARGAFHGFTLGALSLCGIPVHARPYEPLLPDVTHVAFGDAPALAAAVSARTAAVVLEPVQAEIGAETPPAGYLAEARSICDAAGALLVVDEVRTGMGRTGPLFAIEEDGVMPDILLVGKSLGSGIVPIGAMLAHRRIWGRVGLTFTMSASSFSGNRLACIAALATLDQVDRSDVLERARKSAAVLRAGLEQLHTAHATLLDRITGRGLLVGLHFRTPQMASDVARIAIQRGLLVATAFCNNRCILLEPPLTITEAEIGQALHVLSEACDTTRRGIGPIPVSNPGVATG
jgi:putrescine aminotransferase